MDDKTLKILEFDKVLDKISRYATSAPGKEWCLNLKPAISFRRIESWQKNTADALRRISMAGKVISFSGVKDISLITKRLEIEATLSIREFLDISRILEVTKTVKDFGTIGSSDGDPDSLKEYFDMLDPVLKLNQSILRTIIDENTIADDASRELLTLRHKMRRISDGIHETIKEKLSKLSKYLTDAVITQKDGRMCLPVKSEYKSKILGIVRNVSSTGLTLFIEPMAIVDLNNQLSECKAKERREIEKVLENLSLEARPYIDVLSDNVKILSKLDMIFAKALYAGETDAVRPLFSSDRSINFIQARHPLIEREKVVPIDMRLGGDYRILIITGPNTGGKTVSLKTTGLLTLMAQAGLHIPAKDGSTAGIFTDVYADIGDEQSIEQSLSTFSSHMTNIVEILKKADCSSLCFFDELGSGTDPDEGAALGISILEFLREKGSMAVVTTHYADIKLYALETKDVLNASCEFDVQTLSPTYKLLIGLPGKSNAFEISKRLGLDPHIIDDAKKRLSVENESFENALAKLNEDRTQARKEKEEAEIYLKEAEILRKKLKERKDRLDSSRDKILSDARKKAASILKDARKTADSALKDIDRYSSENDFERAKRKRDLIREELRKVENAGKEKLVEKGPSKRVSPKRLKEGDSVKVMPMGGAIGNVVSLPDKDNNIVVQLGFMTTRVNVKDVEFYAEQGDVSLGNIFDNHDQQGINLKKVPKGRESVRNLNLKNTVDLGSLKPKALTISPKINLIGMTTDEARPKLEKYLDDAYLAHIPEVQIVHGRGSGALKNMTHTLLKQTKYVDSYRLGIYGEGDSGVTIARFGE